MGSCMEDATLGQDILRSGGSYDSTVILTGKKNKRSGKSQGCQRVLVESDSKISKSHKRKLKKLEEEKERAMLLSKSIEILEKYKIPDDALSLLSSSRSIGQIETAKEKRRRAVQFSKAGFAEVLHGNRTLKKVGGDTACEAELNAGNNKLGKEVDAAETMHPIIVEGEVRSDYCVSSGTYQDPMCGCELKRDGPHDFSMPASSNATEKSTVSVEEDMSNLLTTTCIKKVGMEQDGSGSIQELHDDSARYISEGPLHSPSKIPTVVHVSRPNEVVNSRKDLPIVMMEQEIMEAINYHPTVIICGETGCGKTTQVPQFLFEAGFGSNHSSLHNGIVGVTQPRRVAVLATAKRVAYELGLCLGREVGFQVRHDKMVGQNCSIKFMTDGILLREVQSDFSLKKYSVIILDEAHERSLNTDILIGMLSRVVQERQKEYVKQQSIMLSGGTISSENIISPLKLILMSATLRVEDFVSGRRLFRDPPPVIEVPTRQYPVTIHFSRRTELVDYTGQTYKTVMSIHKRLPTGGILVFVTGQREVELLCRKLRKASKEVLLRTGATREDKNSSVSEGDSDGIINVGEINEAFETNTSSVNQQTDRFSSCDAEDSDLDEDGEDESDGSYDSGTDGEQNFEDEDEDGSSFNEQNIETLVRGAISKINLEGISGTSEGCSTSKMNSEGISGTSEECPLKGQRRGEYDGFSSGKLRVLPLYAMLPGAEQLRVFEETKEGERLVVVATNVAETSLTIPGIKYVVDTGREKVKNYNPSSGMEVYEVQWISKASAAQRAGRAGRTGPGHCYRLYSSAVFNNTLPDFSKPEISKVPIDGVVLVLKTMNIHKVANFPFPTPPEAASLVEAERCLMALEAIDNEGRLMPMGRAMARYPMSPRHSRMLLTVIQITGKAKHYIRPNLVLGYAAASAAALSLSNPFIMQLEGTHNNGDNLEMEEKLRRKKQKESVKSARAKFSNPCSDALTVAYALQCFELSENRAVFCKENALHLKTVEEMSKLRKQLLRLVFNSSIGCDDFSWIHGTMEEIENAWGCPPSRKPPLSLNEEEVLGQAICAGWADRVAKRIRSSHSSPEGDKRARAIKYQTCTVKETVFLHRWSFLSSSAPEFLVYKELLLHTKRPYLHGATSVKPEWLAKYSSSLCCLSAPLTDPKPYYEPFSDEVMCWVNPTFGPHLWKLPPRCLPVAKRANRVAVFGYALLDGQVLPCLKSVRRFMAAPPSSLLKPEALGQARVGNLLNKLRDKSIDSCAKLREEWSARPGELYAEILDWFQGCFRCHFEELWLQMRHEIDLEPRERFPKRAKEERRRSNAGH